MQIKLNGIDYYAYTANHKPRGNLDTIVFVHGTAMDHTVWSHQSRVFCLHR
jgi:pimeloyl-ACP methyl ester carboxylesterase